MVSSSNHSAYGKRSILRQAQDDRPSYKLSFFGTFGLAFCFLLSAFCSGCSFNPDLQGKGQAYLQGEWQQDTSAIQQKLITFSHYHIRFECDSFFLQLNNYSRVNYGTDSCRHNGKWAEYVKGHYAQKNDTLFLKGFYCNANFTLKNEGCFNIGVYQEFFKISKQTDSLVQLQGAASVIPINLKLVKRTICHQKPL